MSSGADFIFFLQDKQNRFWQIDNAGNVTLNANPYPLQFSPDGWDDIIIKNVRNKKYWGIDRSVSTQYKFVEDGAKILKYIFSVKGIEEPVYFSILEQQLEYNPGVSYGYWYKLRFKSEIDMSTYQHNGPVVTCNTLEDGLAKHLKANESTIYEIPVGTEKIKMDGVILHSTYRWLVLADAAITERAIPQMSIIESEGLSSGFAVFDVQQSSGFGIDDGNMSYIATCIKDITGINITFDFVVQVEFPMAEYIIELVKFNPTTGTTNTIPVFSDELVAGVPTTISIDVTFDMAKNDRLFFVSDGADVSWQETTLVMNVDTRHSTTYIPFARPQYLFANLIDKITDGEYSAEDCPYFSDLHHSDKVFMSGDHIRGIATGPIKLSLSQFFEFFDTYDAVGFREKERKVLFDRKASLTDSINLIDLGEVSKMVVSFDKSLPFNELLIGYPDVKNENGMLNGKNEVNTTFTFSLGTTKTPRKYEKVSKIKASCYDIENIRIEGTGKETTDRKTDNDVYCIHISKTLVAGSGDIPDHYELNREYNAYVTGVDQSATVFNLALSPKNCMVNSGDYLSSLFYKCDWKKLKFISADRNALMAYINGPNVLVENADIYIHDLAAPFFTPVQIQFETDAPDDLIELLDSNPVKGYKWTFDGTEYKGICIESSINPKTNKKQAYTMLSHPDNDITKLIEYYG